MLAPALRAALSTLRRAGWRPWALAALSWAPVIAVAASGLAPLIVFALLAQNCVLLALVAFLGVQRRPPLGDAPPTLRGTLRRAVSLLRPAGRLTLLQALALVTSVALLLLLSGGKAIDTSDINAGLRLTVAGELARAPLGALLLAFIMLAPQRIALERDERVLVAAAHSVRVARAHFGSLFALALVEPAVVVAGLAVGRSSGAAVVAAFALALVVARVVVTAAANEAFALGPRLDVPAEFGRRRNTGTH